MNVVRQEKKNFDFKPQSKPKNQLVRKDASLGIRGPTTLFSMKSHDIRAPNKNPRYQFDHEYNTHNTKKPSMGPPVEFPRNLKRKIISSSTPSKPESSFSRSKIRPRVLASDSAVENSSHDFCTPRNRPLALRYISSSSRGGHSSTRSTRSASTSAIQASVILAISEGRGMARGEIGIAAVDVRRPHLVLCQFSDTLLYTHTLTKINYFNPLEIILPHTFCEGTPKNQLYKLIRDQYPLITLSPVQRRHFNAAVGRQHIQTLCAPQYSSVYIQVLEKFYALTAAAAVLKYVEHIQCIVFSRESVKIEYHSSENTMIIDVGTATQLELVQPLVPSAGPTCCLLGVLGPTYTIGGIRALRASILQPSCNKESIEVRFDAVQDLIENEDGLMTALQDVIKNLTDVDKILFLCVEPTNLNIEKMCEAQINQTILLKTTMEMVPKFVEALSSAESGKLRKIKMDFENPHYNEIAERIRQIIQEDAHLEKGAMASLQRCFAVKPDINGLLDVARRTYSELIDDIQKIVEQLAETYDLPLRLNQNMMRGFHIVMSVAHKNRRNFNVEDLPAIFIQVQNNGASVTMTTEELVVLNQQAKESLNEIQKMSNIVISGLLKELRPLMSSLYELCENIAELDILLSLAQVSSIGSYIRPEFNTYMEVRNSVHPLLDYNTQVMPVPNDIYASAEYNFTIITGPNMGGKSIYIKQIALMQIMAQIGCFVPATNAVLRLSDRIFSRIGFNDSVELNASTYVLEMKEIQHILQGLTPTSLVIIDELCRGTSIDEGTSIAWAICEELLLSDAFTFFTTHFIYLTRLQDLYYNVVNLHTTVMEEEVNDLSSSEKRLVYQHKIEPGVTKIEYYGLKLAAKTNLPEATVSLAKELAELIAKNRKPCDFGAPQDNDNRMLYKLNANLRKESRKTNSTNDSIKKILVKFKDDNPELIERLKLDSIDNFNKNNKTDDYFKEKSNTCISEKTVCKKYSEDTDIENLIMVNDGGIIKALEDKTENEIRRYTAVKSSNELLNTVLTISDDASNKSKPVNISNRANGWQSESASNILDDSNLLDVNNITIDEHTSSPHSKRNSNNNLNDVARYNDFVTQMHKDNSDTSSTMAEALTQVIECSIEDDASQVRRNISSMSIDEDLIDETIKEIETELSNGTFNLENIVLTPPIGFRD